MAAPRQEQVLEGTPLAESRSPHRPAVAPQVEIPTPPGITAEMYRDRIPTGPPPGLRRTNAPRPADIHLLNNDDNSLFSDFASYLDKGEDEDGKRVIARLTCSICQDRTLFPSCATASDDSFHPARSEWMAVLPCGHFFGADCLANWLQHHNHQGTTMTCPLCRFEMRYTCGHAILPHQYNPSLCRTDQMPLTLPEGGTVPWNCRDCYALEVGLVTMRLRGLLFPAHVNEGDLRTAGSGEFLDSVAGLLMDIVDCFWMAGTHYNRWFRFTVQKDFNACSWPSPSIWKHMMRPDYGTIISTEFGQDHHRIEIDIVICRCLVRYSRDPGERTPFSVMTLPTEPS
ncbi:hypothetical protein GGR50DRAFT_186536 [Xylaria sp. CBS 124048]|nr:hypothetical protein GGR50DRAFT_186536 [Xylaria sp. CBS 124048]